MLSPTYFQYIYARLSCYNLLIHKFVVIFISGIPLENLMLPIPSPERNIALLDTGETFWMAERNISEIDPSLQRWIGVWCIKLLL